MNSAGTKKAGGRKVGACAGLLFLALALVRGAGAQTPEPTQTPKEQAWKVLNVGLGQTNTGDRAAAVRELGFLPGDAGAEKEAVDALYDPKSDVRIAAASALGQMGAKESVPKLIEILNDKDAGVVLAGASSLTKLGDHHGYEVYYAVLTGERKSGAGLVADQKKMLSDPKKMAEFGFAEGIGFIPFAGMGYGAFKMVTKDDVSPVRAAAARALADDPDPKSGEALVQAASDKNWIVRAAAIDAIARRNEAALIPSVLPMLGDEKDVVRYTAAAAIIHLSSLGDAKPQKAKRKKRSA